MLIGIVSDTHDDLAAVEAAIELFAREDVDAIVHCGDFVSPFSVTPFSIDGTDAPEFYAVRGNNDGEWAVQSTVETFGTYFGEAGTLTVDDTKIAITHGTSQIVVDALVDCGDYDYVLHGHTHAHGVEERDGTVRVNPGGLPIPIDDADDSFHVAILDTTRSGTAAVTHQALN